MSLDWSASRLDDDIAAALDSRRVGAVFGQLGAAISVFDRGLRLVAWNEAAGRLFRWGPDALGQTLEYQVDAKQLSTGAKGEEVGSVTVTTPDGPVTVRLELDGRLGDPGPLWRLLNPVPVITAFIDSRTQD